jgi:enamine deaminase RidA (YjgF/YER057c/UK114 family)
MAVTSKSAQQNRKMSSPNSGHSGASRRPNGAIVIKPVCYVSDWSEHSLVDLADSKRIALMITPQGRGPIRDQVQEVVEDLSRALAGHPDRMALTAQTVFLRDSADRAVFEEVFSTVLKDQHPVTNFVLQSPCCGAALAVEAWAIGGKDVCVERHGPWAVSVRYDHVRWVYVAGVEPGPGVRGVHAQTMDALRRMNEGLMEAGSNYQHVVRTWLYLGGITEKERNTQRYKELNRARTDFYRDIPFCRALLDPNVPRGVYPASTGIGMAGQGLMVACVALETARDDVFLFPLENPQQTPAYAYHPRYSPKSPKFSRAMALVLGDYVTTWISGTASIVDSESWFPGDVARQTEQTIDNIERLIAAENFAQHGIKGAGATLGDLAKVRVYLKRASDFEVCREVCRRRFGTVPAIYAVADVCRPELLVEIEGVAFSRYSGPHRREAGLRRMP